MKSPGASRQDQAVPDVAPGAGRAAGRELQGRAGARRARVRGKRLETHVNKQQCIYEEMSMSG